MAARLYQPFTALMRALWPFYVHECWILYSSLDLIFPVGLNIPRGNLVFSININVVFVALSLQHTKNEIIFYIREHYSKIIFMYFIIKLGPCGELVLRYRLQ